MLPAAAVLTDIKIEYLQRVSIGRKLFGTWIKNRDLDVPVDGRLICYGTAYKRDAPKGEGTARKRAFL